MTTYSLLFFLKKIQGSITNLFESGYSISKKIDAAIKIILKT